MTMVNLFTRPSGKFLAERWRLFFLKENKNTKKKKMKMILLGWSAEWIQERIKLYKDQ